MIEDVPLFQAALAAVSIQARYEYPDGWTVQVNVRREGEQWSDSGKARYDRLATAEALDVIEAHVAILRADHGLEGDAQA